MRPLLERSLDFSRNTPASFAPYAHIADPLIDGPDEGMTTAKVQALFAELRSALVPIVRAIVAQPLIDDSCLRGSFPEAAQMAFSLAVIKRVGYDLGADGSTRRTIPSAPSLQPVTCASPHVCARTTLPRHCSPRCTRPATRFTSRASTSRSRARPQFGRIGGRAREPVAAVGERGRPQPGFWEHFYPLLRDTFPDHFKAVPLETFYRAINKVAQSLIRTDADEVTYNLHIMMRFDLELALLEGRLAVKDLPEAWRARFEADFGIAPPDDRDGCLQDVHWYAGSVGGASRVHHRQHPGGAVSCRRARRAPADSGAGGAGRVCPRCTHGCASTSTGMGASSRRTSWWSAPPRTHEDCALHRLFAHQVRGSSTGCRRSASA
jgi:carboxypeptidase Taq